jgi:hypothetical protein
MGRAPVRATAIRAQEPEAPKRRNTPVAKVGRLRKDAAQRSLLDIDAGIIAMLVEQYEADLQWVADSVLGKPDPASRNAFEINGWLPVTPDMFGGVFDGMYTRKGDKGEIRIEGLVLMYRHISDTEEAKAEEARARIGAMKAQENMIKGGVIPGLSSGFESNHPTAISRNVFNRTVHEPMDIPRE